MESDPNRRASGGWLEEDSTIDRDPLEAHREELSMCSGGCGRGERSLRGGNKRLACDRTETEARAVGLRPIGVRLARVGAGSVTRRALGGDALLDGIVVHAISIVPREPRRGCAHEPQHEKGHPASKSAYACHTFS